MNATRHSSSYLLRKRRAALSVLANPTATDEQRHRARCLLNRVIDVMRRLRDIAPMKYPLETDRQIARSPERFAARPCQSA